MSRKGNCWDNAPVESFFATLKKELIHPLGEVTNFFRWRERSLSIFKAYYNTIRTHSFLGYLSPLEFQETKIGSLVRFITVYFMGGTPGYLFLPLT